MEIIIVVAIIFWIVKSLFSGLSKPEVTISLYAGHESTPEEDEREEKRRQAEEKDRQRTFRIGMAELNIDIGMKEAVCPSCGVVLAEFPKRKTKCKDCGNIIYKRKRPWDKIEVLLVENQLEEFDNLIEKYYFIKKHRILNYPYYEEELKKNEGVKTVNFQDVVEYKYILDKKLLSQKNKWREYIIVNNQLLVFYQEVGNFLEALKRGLENEYLDFCRPIGNINGSGFMSKEDIKFIFGHKEYKIRDDRLQSYIEQLGLSKEDVRKIFYNLDIHSLYKFPRTKEDAWRKCVLPWLKSFKSS